MNLNVVGNISLKLEDEARDSGLKIQIGGP